MKPKMVKRRKLNSLNPNLRLKVDVLFPMVNGSTIYTKKTSNDLKARKN